MTDTPDILPTESLVIEWPADIDPDDFEARSAYANAQIISKAAELIVEGKRPWFEVWYPNASPFDFDAVEVAEDGTITTLPPYSELKAASA